MQILRIFCSKLLSCQSDVHFFGSWTDSAVQWIPVDPSSFQIFCATAIATTWQQCTLSKIHPATRTSWKIMNWYIGKYLKINISLRLVKCKGNNKNWWIFRFPQKKVNPCLRMCLERLVVVYVPMLPPGHLRESQHGILLAHKKMLTMEGNQRILMSE